ncbi:hypothetical protein PV326_011155 [Microctonus aethiopoides]|nr:hypothetical protein PV326_011155 [Microctonus aethiopoides]
MLQFIEAGNRGRPKVVHSPKVVATRSRGGNDNNNNEIEKEVQSKGEKKQDEKEQENKKNITEERNTLNDKSDKGSAREEEEREGEEKENHEEQNGNEEVKGNKEKEKMGVKIYEAEELWRAEEEEGEEEGPEDIRNRVINDVKIENLLLRGRINALEGEVRNIKGEAVKANAQWEKEKKEMMEVVRGLEEEVKRLRKEVTKEIWKQKEDREEKRRAEEIQEWQMGWREAGEKQTKQGEREEVGWIEKRQRKGAVCKEKERMTGQNKTIEGRTGARKQDNHEKKKGTEESKRGESKEKEKEREAVAKPMGITEDHWRYELRERRERRNRINISTKEGNVKEKMREACQKLRIDGKKYRVKYEGLKKISIEFKSIEEKLQALERKNNLKGTGERKSGHLTKEQESWSRCPFGAEGREEEQGTGKHATEGATFKCMCWNVHGTGRFAEIGDLVERQDLIILQETWLTEERAKQTARKLKLGLTVRNGRTKGDREGKITYVGGGDTYKGSVLDIVIEVDRGDEEAVEKLEIITRVESDHLPVTFEVKRGEKRKKEHMERKGKGEDGRRKIKWEKDREKQYTAAVIKKIKEVEENERREVGDWESIKRIIWEAAKEVKMVKKEITGWEKGNEERKCSENCKKAKKRVMDRLKEWTEEKTEEKKKKLRERDGVQKKIREELEEWWEQECKKEEEKIKKSTYNTIYKEITAEAVGNEYLNSKGINMEDRVIWARMRCGNIGRAGKKGEKEWTCRLCGGEDETMWHLLECEEATREQEEETKKELGKWKGNKGKGEMQEMIIRELKGEINTIICRYMRKVEEKIKRERQKKEMGMEEEEEESERE